jgi:DinB superfamily
VDSCPQCGFVYDEIPVTEIPGAIRAFASTYREILAACDSGTVTRRVDQATWSALEYACHVRDVFLVQRDRVVMAQVLDRPRVIPMSRDERVAICRYDSQSLDDVLDQLAMATELCAMVFEGLTPTGWTRQLVYNWPTTEVRDLLWVGRNAVHEGTHHLRDVKEVLARVT